MLNNKYFSVALFVENLKRFWLISLTGIALYFLGGVYSIGLDKATDDYLSSSMITDMLQNRCAWIVLLCILPCVSALCVFSYLQKTNSCCVIHSQPYSRTSLFITNYVSGLTIASIPLFVTFIELLLLQGDTYEIFWDHIAGKQVKVISNVFCTANICQWLFSSFIALLVVYSVCVLASILSGNGVIAFLTSVCANGVLQVLTLCLYIYMSRFFFGFADNDDFFYNVIKFHPITAFFADFDTPAFLIDRWYWYVLGAVVISGAAYYHYRIRKLEKCGDSYVFEWCNVFVGFVFTFVPSSIFYELFRGWGYIGFVIPGLIGFVIGQMIIRKNFRIFDMKTLKNLILYALIMTVVILSLVFDVFGYEKKVPKQEEVSYAFVDVSYNSNYYDLSENIFRSEESIKAITELHQKMIDREYDKPPYDQDDEITRVRINYKTKLGTSINREYYVSKKYFEQLDCVHDLAGSDEMYQNIQNIYSLDINNISVDYVNASNNGSYGYIERPNLSNSQKQQLIDLIVKDLLNHHDSYNNCEVSLTYIVKAKDTAEYRKIMEKLQHTRGYSYEDFIGNDNDGNRVYEIRFYYNISDDKHFFDEYLSDDRYSAAEDRFVILANYYEDLFGYNENGEYGLVQNIPNFELHQFNPHSVVLSEDNYMLESIYDVIYHNDNKATAEEWVVYAAVYEKEDGVFVLKDVALFDSNQIAKRVPWIYESLMAKR